MACVPKMAHGKISMASRIHWCPNFLLFCLPDQCLHIVKNVCACMRARIEIAYELPLLPNNNAVKHFCTNRCCAKC